MTIFWVNLKVDTVEKKSQRKQKWLYHVSRMEDIRHPKQLDYQHIRRQRPGWPLKGPLDGYSREAKTGHFQTW